MKLHYSQTYTVYAPRLWVSVPYEITLLSNKLKRNALDYSVSVPYEITLLSNHIEHAHYPASVSVPYEITLLSNLK